MSASKAPQVQIERDEHYDVFISYRRGACGNRNINDLVSAIQLELMLKAKGLTVFVDKSGIAAGDTWRDKFMTELRHAQVVILIVSRNTMCRYERPKTDLVSVFSGMLVSGVQALAEPLVSLAGGSSSSSTPPPRASSTDGVDNLLLEWMIAMSLQKQKIIVPVFIGDSDAATGVVGDLLEQRILQNLAEPPARVLDATRAYASAYLASQCDPPVLLADCCASLSSLITDGVGEKNAVVVRSVAWEIVPEIVVSHILHSPQMREVLATLSPKKGAAGPASDDSLRSPGSPFTPKELLRSFNSPLQQTDDSAESLYENCFMRTQLWPHAAQGKAHRRRDSAGFSLFIAEPAQLRGTCVDLFPPPDHQTFFVFITRGENPNCSEFVATWNGNRCTLQLPHVHESLATISCHHATLRFCAKPFERHGLGLADGHVPSKFQSECSTACPCSLPNPHGKTSSLAGTFALSFPCAGSPKERRVLMKKRVLTAADEFRINPEQGGFAALDGFGATFMYFMLSNVVIGVSDPVAQPPHGAASPHILTDVPGFSPTLCWPNHDFSVVAGSPAKPFSSPENFSNVLGSSLFGGFVNDMERGGWEKMSSCWSD